ncbi:hypothetical protein PsAD2_02135 [Pseudovibrio axinellae]|uniref:TIGR02300 family protein n=1 Tax=Pseudovibrio axinellae TaxID=989403 RepID=A0A165YZP8_9HYPH|nr:TIGR02300 family protein [Pseudovibrio axinellae]KZL19379.1 hypothetical protein PsAD2_02135 [Pseudovibrio axinellae]SEQ38876.1 TIGR02300 family protein [Pseudovibrio axinellae]
MARPELGTKRLCAACGAKYYDLNRNPITCPKCGDMLDLGMAAKTAKAVKAVQKEEAKEALVKDDAEMVSLEEADKEASGEDIPDLDDDGISDDIGGDDSDVFLDEEDDEETSVPGIVVSHNDSEG